MEEFKQIAHKLGCTYIKDDFARINLHADKVVKYPLICETLPTGGEIVTQHAPAMSYTKDIILCFLAPCRLDFSGREASDIIDKMVLLARKFIVMYCESHGADMPARLRYNAVLDFLDVNLAGVRVTLTTTSEISCV